MKSDDVIVKDSLINGKGVFATKNFKEGEVVLHWDISHLITKEEFEKKTDQEKTNIFLMDDRYGIMAEPEKYANHSCNANTTAKNFYDIAKRDISIGEEITVDYSEALPPNVFLRCNCGSDNCKKIIKRSG
ncbi:MAG: hypothetical protein UR60_C0015G0018 [Candidatus Moranbacteria bacterium GW2011_GWF2_34_56]|nr:MAG: hypothetical protein UR51_C0003G0012 [Candidatus Moranbacteria bacterium GW2011_GWF1_34_10]KKP64793.1 MAG: hypothetical protein UR60_C0015G0018 [Candidatus Moranbacteria bacterium GW2011_GWF2_34_56]HBI16859.1 hypothetical protein [Candidatus Moranbacteria bacterium]